MSHSASNATNYGSLTTNYGEIGERLSEQFKKDLHELLIQPDTDSN